MEIQCSAQTVNASKTNSNVVTAELAACRNFGYDLASAMAAWPTCWQHIAYQLREEGVLPYPILICALTTTDEFL